LIQRKKECALALLERCYVVWSEGMGPYDGLSSLMREDITKVVFSPGFEGSLARQSPPPRSQVCNEYTLRLPLVLQPCGLVRSLQTSIILFDSRIFVNLLLYNKRGSKKHIKITAFD